MASITFDVDPSKVPSKDFRPPRESSFKEYLSEYKSNYKIPGKIIKTTENPNMVSPKLGNGFVGSAFKAYCDHLNWTISPDVVWTAIMTAFARYVNKNAEEMRHLFVSHEGKIELKSCGFGNIITLDYDDVIDQLSKKIDEHTVDDVIDWVQNNFSTTTVQSKTVSKLVLMGVVKKYFSYKIYTFCGFPSVTLLGTLEDWQAIRSRVDRFQKYGLENWSKILGTVLDQFIASYEGGVNVDFWKRAISSTGGSGATSVTGWMMAFIPFNEDGEYILEDPEAILESNYYGKVLTGSVPASAVEVPVTIIDGGTKYETKFFTGAYMSTYNAEKQSMGTSLDWAINVLSTTFE